MNEELQRQTVGTAAPAINNGGDNPFGNGNWTSRFDPDVLPRVPFEIVRMTVRGPAGSALQGYVDTQYKFGTSRASLNEWTGSRPIRVDPGQSIIIYWNTAATPAPFVQMYLRPL